MAEWDYAGLAGMDDFEELNQEPASFGSSYKEKEPSVSEHIASLEDSARFYLKLVNEYKWALNKNYDHNGLDFTVRYMERGVLGRKAELDTHFYDYI